jgi:hypothetical protein
MLTLISLTTMRCIPVHFGFLQWMAGSGSTLLFSGILSLGTWFAGQIIGGISIAWGVISIVAHFMLRGQGGHVNAPLLSR